MIGRPPRSKRTYTPFPYTTLCRSPRRHGGGEGAARLQHPEHLVQRLLVVADVLQHLRRDDPIEGGVGKRELQRVAVDGGGQRPGCRPSLAARSHGGEEPGRSEEHTSELQSLMRLSYAVFCLK